MAMDRARNFLDNIVANAVFAILSAVGVVVWASLKNEPPHRIAVMAIVVLAAVLFILDRVRAHLLVPTTPSPTAQPASDVVGRTVDGRTILKLGDRLAELDSWAVEFYEAQDDPGKERIRRALRACIRARFNRFDLMGIVSGRMPDDEPVYVTGQGMLAGGGRRTHFWTKTEIRVMTEDERRGIGSEVRMWALGRSWSESISILDEGERAVRERLESDAREEESKTLMAGLGTLTQGFDFRAFYDGLRNWHTRVVEHLRT